jgi:8-oxo-dGTP pyrophosphatase MutT (NUDIX family)
MGRQTFKVIPIVAAIIEDDQRRILMVKEAKSASFGLWNQPAGHVDPDESIEEALLREIREETGYVHLRIDGIARIYYFLEENMLRMVYRVSVLDDETVPLADDVLEARWFTRDEIEGLMRQGKLRNRRTEFTIRDWIAGVESSSADLIQTVKRTE